MADPDGGHPVYGLSADIFPNVVASPYSAVDFIGRCGGPRRMAFGAAPLHVTLRRPGAVPVYSPDILARAPIAIGHVSYVED